MSHFAAFCVTSLRVARRMAKEDGLELPKGLSATSCGGARHNRQYNIWSKDGKEHGQTWITACCKSQALSQYITNQIPDPEEA